jgi:hypothetical protein
MFTSKLKGFSQRYIQYWPLALFVLAVFVRLLPGERLIDDAYITFRYARNIVDGLGFVYNPGERVLGTTTPFYTLLLAGLSAIFGTSHLPEISIWINAIADGVTCALLVPLGVAMSGQRRVGIVAGVLYAIAPFSVTFAIGGMETSVLVLLLIATGLLYLERRAEWALTATLALLTRPDALIFIGPMAADFSIRYLAEIIAAHRAKTALPWKTILKPLALFLLPSLPWLIFATLYFGSPIPHSITAKTAAYHLGSLEGFIRLLQHYATPFFEENIFTSAAALLTTLVVYSLLAITGGLNAFRRDSRTWSISIYPAVYFAVFAIANPLIFRWYLTPPLAFYFLLILTSLSHVVEKVAKQVRLTPITSQLFGLICLFFVALSLRAWVLVPDHGPNRPAPDMAWFKLEQIYTQVGQELASDIRPGQVIAASDIGALGYFSNAKILDILGLVSTQSTAYYPLPPEQLVINYAIPAKLVTDQKPDYVVFLEVYGRRTLLIDPEFLNSYKLREKIPTDIYGSNGMLIYERHDN